MATGPQRYPGASTGAAWYQDTYGGTAMEVNVVVLHTTEGRTLPDYDGGALAPNLTAVPDFAAKKLRWFQHFDIDRSSRALVNLAGGVETNTLNVCQVELVGTCDPATHKKWTAAGQQHVYWPEAPDWALAGVADFLRWLHAEHGVPLSGPAKWPAYPGSYGKSNGARMTAEQWLAFKGVCGHLHVVENEHGDPGAIDFPKLIALAKGSTVPEEDDVALTDADITKIATRVLTLDGVIDNPNPATAPGNPFISLETAVRNIETIGRRTEATLTAQVGALSAALAKLAEGGGLDAGEIQAAAEAGAQAALDRLGDALTKEN